MVHAMGAGVQQKTELVPVAACEDSLMLTALATLMVAGVLTGLTVWLATDLVNPKVGVFFVMFGVRLAVEP
jgi:hypothetical protein